jgi:transposase
MIRGLCATFGFKPGPGQGKAFIDRVMEAANIPGLGQSITALLAVRTGLMKQIKEMDLVLREFAHRSQSCRQLMSIPGVGVQTSAAFAAAVDEAGRFRQSRAAGAYFGLVPDVINPERSTGQAALPSKATVWCASCSTKRPTRS